MEEKLFWHLLSQICEMGEFIAAVRSSGGASANIVGKLRVGMDGGETVLERQGCQDHIHLQPEQVAGFAFTHLDVGFGSEPCVELRAASGEPVMKLFYRGRDAAQKCDRFVAENASHQSFISGAWS